MYLKPIKTYILFYSFHIHWNFIQNKISRIDGILFNGVLIPKLLNNTFHSCSSINLYFSIPHKAHFDCIINMLFFLLEIFEFKFSVFFIVYTISQHTFMLSVNFRFNHFWTMFLFLKSWFSRITNSPPWFLYDYFI